MTNWHTIVGVTGSGADWAYYDYSSAMAARCEEAT